MYGNCEHSKLKSFNLHLFSYKISVVISELVLLVPSLQFNQYLSRTGSQTQPCKRLTQFKGEDVNIFKAS